MQLLSIIDPRDNLQKATRFELIEYAKANGIEVPDDAPAIYTMKVLRSRGLVNIKIPERPLGLYVGKESTTGESMSADIITSNAEDDLVRQYEAEKRIVDEPEKLPMHKVRSALKAKGIKFSRRDNLQTLRGLLTQ